MKALLALLILSVVLTGCYGPGGPATRAGNAVDNAVYNTGTAVKRTGQTIQNVATD